MGDYKHVRCVFCASGKEIAVVDELRRRSFGEALYPTRVKRIYRRGRSADVKAAIFPGYVFLYSDADEINRRELQRIGGVNRLLTYKSDDRTADRLMGRDREFADWLWRIGGQIDIMEAVKNGEKIAITDEAFKNMHGRIIKMDRRKQAFQVALEGELLKNVWLSYTVVETPPLTSFNYKDFQATDGVHNTGEPKIGQ